MANGTTDKSSEPTQSVTQQDASTTQGKQSTATPSSEGGAATTNATGVQRVQIEQAPTPDPVNYEGDPNATNPDKPHVRADYQPFEWK